MARKKKEETEKKNLGGRPRKYDTAEQMQEAIDRYYSECEEREWPLTMSGLADALDMDRITLFKYSKDGRFRNTVKKARMKVECQVEKLLLEGKAPAGAIFWMKNNAGWVDRTEVERSGPGGGPIKYEWKVTIVDPGDSE